MHAVGLRSRNRVGSQAAVFEQERTGVAWSSVGNDDFEVFAIAPHGRHF
jgi:hypothetical protein